MKKLLSSLLCLAILLGCCVSLTSADYIPVHTEEELSALFERFSVLMQENEEAIDTRLGETESMVLASAFLRSWAVEEYEDASAEMIDEAYDTLLNASLFLGLTLNVRDTLFTDPEMPEKLFTLSHQLLDQEYYDLLQEQGEDPSVIAYAEELRDRADVLADDPDSLNIAERDELYNDLWTELYLAAGLKTIDHAQMLPTPEELFGEDPDAAAAMIPNPMVTSSDSQTVDALLRFPFPDLAERFGWTLDHYAVIADLVAEAEYTTPDGGTVLLRLSPSTDADISGVYNAEFYADRTIFGSEAEFDRYQTMWIAKGVTQLYSGEAFAFAVDTDKVDFETFETIVNAFIEACRNSKIQEQ